MEIFSSPESVPQISAFEVLTGLLESDLQKFRIFFRYLRDAFPNEACQACVRYLGAGEGDSATAQHILAWLKGSKYFELLTDPQFLAIEEARRVAEALRTEDSRFFLNFSRLTVDGTPSQEQHEVVARALALLDGLKDYGVLFSWLRGLTDCSDERIQSQAVKVFCRLRSNTALILRQLKAEDGRVRANAIEALWQVQTPEAAGIFLEVLGDVHHRVVVNALIGLHCQKDPSALERLMEYAGHVSELHRTAVVWAFGYLEEPKGVPVLERMATHDSSALVREKAARALAALSGKQSAAVAA